MGWEASEDLRPRVCTVHCCTSPVLTPSLLYLGKTREGGGRRQQMKGVRRGASWGYALLQ
jgi:hypothetical protein